MTTIEQGLIAITFILACAYYIRIAEAVSQLRAPFQERGGEPVVGMPRPCMVYRRARQTKKSDAGWVA